MKVSFNDFKSEPHQLKTEMNMSIQEVLDSGSFILGEKVEQFEKEWAKYCGVNNVVSVGNCFDATMLGMQALGIGKGDEVITTPETAFATSLAILKLGAIPVMADIDLSTGHMSIESAAKCISPKTKAILFVHLYGQAGNVIEWLDFCNSNNILFLEDCAQAHGVKFNGKSVGTFGKFGAWSYYPTKNLGCLGDGGALSTNDDDLSKKVGMLRNYGQSKRYYHDLLGVNSRLDEIQASILSTRLKFLDQFNLRRKEIAKIYNENINNVLIEKLSSPIDEDSHVYHLYVLRSEKRNELMKYLTSKTIDNLIHYPVLVNDQIASKDLVKVPFSLKNAKYHADTCFSLPCHPQMTDEQIYYVIENVNKFNF